MSASVCCRILNGLSYIILLLLLYRTVVNDIKTFIYSTNDPPLDI